MSSPAYPSSPSAEVLRTSTGGHDPNPGTGSTATKADDYIYDALIDAILGHQLPPGTRLVESRLCEAFAVTRGTLRRVFVRLAHEGVIELQPNRGAIIAAHNHQEAQEVFDARMMLELGALAGASRKADRKALRELHAMVVREQQLLEQGAWRDWVRQSGEFHIRLAELNQNSIVSSYLRTLVARSSLLIGLYDIPGRNHCSADEHAAIVAAIEAGDPDRASALMRAHLCECADNLLVEAGNAREVNFTQLFSPAPAA